MIRKHTVVLLFVAAPVVFCSNPPNVSQVLMWSTFASKPIDTTRGLISRPLFSVYAMATPMVAGSDAFVPLITNAQNYRVAHSSALSSALSANIAVALSVIPLSSPTSGVILKKDPATGAELPAGAQLMSSQNISDPAPTELNGATPMKKGLRDAGHGSFNQFSGAFGYKVKVMGNLVATFQWCRSTA